MSMNIDERIVSMQFDNAHFEKNVQQSMSTLEKLKQSLRLDGAAKAAQSEFESYSSGFFSFKDSINKATSLWEYDLGNRMKNLAKEVATAFSTQAMKAGFSEYELKMGSIQTIMASTGESLETVNQYLGELNEYSDKTIYSFQDMTSNIGKFTNAGVNLEDSVAAIKGVSNVAAISGANANEASRAMYNFAQALSSGYVKLIDWKSIENANMATVEFKNQLLEAAAAEGKLTKASDGTYKTLNGTVISATKNFNDSLQEQWMTSDVLIGTLKKYADETTGIGKKASAAATEVKTFGQLWDTLKESAQSGWAQTWEIIVGDFEEAKKFLSEVNDVIGGLLGNSAEARNELLENWKVLDGREDLIESLRNTFKGLSSIIKPISEAFNEMFPPLTAEKLKGFTEGLKNLTAKMTLSDEASDNLKRTFKGIFAVIDIVGKALGFVVKLIGKVLGVTDDLAGGILSVTAVIGDWLVNLNEAIENSGFFGAALDIVANIIQTAIKGVGKFIGALKNTFVVKAITAAVQALGNVLTNTEDGMNAMAEAGKKIKDAWVNSGIGKFLSNLWKIIKSVVGGIIKLLDGLFESIANSFGSGDFTSGFELINTILSGGLLIAMGGFISKLKELFTAPKTFIDAFTDVLDSAKDALDRFGQSTTADNIKAIALALGVLVISLIALSFLDTDKLSNSLAAMTLAFGELMLVMGIANKASTLKIWEKSANGVISMVISLLIMAVAIEKIGSLDWATWGRGLIGVTVALAALSGAMIMLTQLAKVGDLDGKNLKKAVGSLITMSISLLIISYAIEKIGSLPWDAWGRGLIGIVTVLAALAGAQIMLTKLAGSGKKMLQAASSILIMSIAINALIPMLTFLALLPTEKLIQSLVAFTTILAVMSGAMVMMTKLANTNKGKLLQASGAIAIMSVSISMLIPVLTFLAVLSVGKLIQSVLGLVAILAALAGAQIMFTKLGGSGKKMLQAAGSIAIMGASLNMLIPMLTFLASLSPGKLIQSVLGLVSILAALAGAQIMFTKLGGSTKNMILASTSIAIMGASLNMLMPTLAFFAILPTGKLIQSVLAFTAILAVLAGAQIMFTKLGGSGKNMILASTSIAIMAAAINILVPALLMLSMMSIEGLITSLVAIAGALTILGLAAKILAPLAPTMITIAGSLALISAAALGFGIALIALGAGLVAIGNGLVVLLAGLTAVAGSIGVVATTLVAFIAAMIEGIILGVGRGIIALCQVLIESIDVIKNVLITIISALCEAIIECVPKIVNTLLELVAELCKSMSKFVPPIVGALLELIAGIISELAQHLPDIIKEVVNLLFALVKGVIDALAGMDSGPLLDALKNVGILAAMMAALAAVAVLTPFAMVGVMSMGIVLGALVGVLSTIGKLSNLVSYEDIQNAGKLLQAVGEAIGSFISGIAKGLTNTLPEIATNLSDFMTNLQPFIDGLDSITPDKLSGVKSLIGVLLGITGADILGSLTTNIFTGENNVDRFCSDLITLAEGVKGFSTITADINPESIHNMAKATSALVDMSNNVPNTGGMIAWITGDNSIANFGSELITLGNGLKGFALATSGINPESVVGAANAAKALAEMSHSIPNTGGIISWLTGDNSIARFGAELTLLGAGIKGFATMTSGINPESVSGAANAAKALAEMTNHIPNTGGVVAWLTGDNSIANFSDDLIYLGEGLAGFSRVTADINSESMVGAAQAAKTIADITNNIPNEGGMVAWFTGDSGISRFGTDLIALGKGLKGFSDQVVGINPESITAASTAAKNLADMTNSIPNEGGIKAWFTGESSLSKFSTDIVELGKGLKEFSGSVKGINAENMSSVANSAKALAEMTQHVPSEGGIKSWFTGKTSIATFADKLPSLGKGLKGFSDSVEGVNTENLSVASKAAKAIAEMTGNTLGKVDKIPTLATNLGKLGSGMKTCFSDLGSISAESVSAAKTAADAIKKVLDLNADKAQSVAKAVKDMGDAIKNLASVPANSTESFNKALSNLGKTSADSLVKSFKDAEPKMKSAGEASIESFISGAKSKSSAATKAIQAIAKSCADAISDSKSTFRSAGSDLVDGFAAGISANDYKAEAKARAMAKAAAQAAEDALDINSPSKVFRAIGYSVPEGFAMGIDKLSGMASDSATNMATESVDNVRSTISRIADVINSDIDAQPTIRPVLDLSAVRSGANSISGLLGRDSSIGVLTNVGRINSAMNRYSQNGESMRLASEIDKLNKNLKGMEHATYNINGVTFSGGSEVEDAFKTILRAAKIERRT